MRPDGRTREQKTEQMRRLRAKWKLERPVVAKVDRRRKDEKAAAMYALYQLGHSLAEVARIFGITRQSVFGSFDDRGWALRSRPAPHPQIMFNGVAYSLRAKKFYYSRTNGPRTLLHRDVWEAAYGPIPKGYDIHHKDGNRYNNDLSNLELLTKSEHTKHHWRIKRAA